jgi:spore germination cell wall hydrolase CwlJ-like protein
MILKTIKVLLGSFLFFGLILSVDSGIIESKYQLISPSTEQQINCLAQNIYYEAATESFEGKLAVAQVTLNRVKSGKFGNTVCKTVYQKVKKTCQFSWVCEKKNRLMRYDSQEFIACKEAAYSVLVYGHRIKKLDNALYYHATYVNPRWNKKVVAKIGKHIFYA